MKRSEFLSGSLCSCLSICTMPLLGASPDQTEPKPKTCQERYDFAQTYVKRLMDILDTELDQESAVRVVQTMGETCARGAYGDKENAADQTPVYEFAKRLQARIEGNRIYWEYTGSPWTGLKIADGYCLCPLTEKGPEGLSGTWCECSVGYVRYMFERYTGSAVQVELLESLKRGGKGCRFRITVV
jgi:hypothetical protein